ncbi:MAG: hypothetical protein ACXVRA_11465 [Gaiellaceae bacterium]
MRVAASVVGVIGLLAVGTATAGDWTSKPTPRPVTISVRGRPATVFNWSRQRCGDLDLADAPARVFRDARGQINLIATEYIDRRWIGPDFNHLRHSCATIMRSDENADPAAFDDRGWIAATWTPDGRTVYALVHDEYQGNDHGCVFGYLACWYNAITLAISRNGGRSYTGAVPRLVASIPYEYTPGGGPAGVFSPTNIVRNSRDGYLYAIVFRDIQDKDVANCLIRTKTPGVAGSWRAWSGGTSFDTTFVDPYGPVDDPAAHSCADILNGMQPGFSGGSLTYNSVAHQWLRVIQGGDGFYYTLSPDLINWTSPVRFYAGDWPGAWKCGDPDPIEYPSLIDPTSTSRNFDTSGSTAYLYYTDFHNKDCRQTLDRDLMRVAVTIRPG